MPNMKSPTTFKGLAKLASIVCPTSVFGAWSLLLASFAGNQLCVAKLASKHRTSNICLPTCKMCLPNMKCLKKLVVAKRASMQGQEVESVSCQANNVGQFRQALRSRSGIAKTVDVWKRTMRLKLNTLWRHISLNSRG